MSEKTEISFVERRAHALAMVLLTSRDDLKVISVNDDAGIDLIVSLTKHQHATFRQFAVILKGSARKLDSARVASQILNSKSSAREDFEAASTPICVFLFSMSGDRGFFAWRCEPITSGGLPKLRPHSMLECTELNEKTLQEIVDRVDAYYDALSKSLVG